MRLKTKLIISFTVLLLLPAILLGGLAAFTPEMEGRASYLLFVALVLFIVAATLATWLYRSAVKPISALRKATKEIAAGNLDYELGTEASGEVGELCDDFESMRKKLKQAEEERKQDDSEHKLLIRNISHDLKTPITAIKGYAGGILDGVASSPEKLDKYVHTIYTKANDMDALIDELTLYAKIDTNRIPYEFRNISAKNFFGSYVDSICDDLEAQKIDFSYNDFMANDANVVIDEEQIRRVLNNIISNSVKYIDKRQGIISFRLRDKGDDVLVEIEDNGQGIPQKDLARIFDRFYRTDESRNSSTGGSGIGLSIALKIITDHGGKIWATSEEGVGTVIHFTLKKGGNHE